MDPFRYNELRRQVLDVMNKHSLQRPSHSAHSRRKSCPALEIPTHFTKTVMTLEKEHLNDITDHLGEPSPPISPKAGVEKPCLDEFTKKEISRYGMVLIEIKK